MFLLQCYNFIVFILKITLILSSSILIITSQMRGLKLREVKNSTKLGTVAARKTDPSLSNARSSLSGSLPCMLSSRMVR